MTQPTPAATLAALLAFGMALGAAAFGGCSTSSESPATVPSTEGSVSGAPGNSARGGAPRSRPLTKEAAAIRARQVGGVSYILWFGLDGSQEDFEGRAVINFELRDRAAESSPELFLDFEGGTLRSFSLNGATYNPEQLASSYDGHRIVLKVSELKAGANRIQASFSHPYSQDGNGLHRFKDPIDGRTYLYTNFEPFHAHRVFPCFDQPDLKASYELTVEAPPDWEVITNTPERQTETVDGRTSWEFAPTPVFSTYLFSIIAGPFASWKSEAHGIPLRLLARKSLATHVEKDVQEWFSVTRDGIELFGVEFGTPFPFAKYDQILVPDFNSGAMENVAAVTFNERHVFRSKETEDRHRGRALTILHELAHMWFGNLVTMRWWNGLWLNESFATFASYWAIDQVSRFKPKRADEPKGWQAFFAGAKQWAYWEDQLVTTHPVDVSVPDTDHAFAHFDGITYGKGASILKQLRYFLGEDAFREGLQRYFQRFAYRNTALADFMRMMVEASGRELGEWQRTWLQTPGLNAVEASWECSPEGKISRFSLRQSNAEGSRELRPHRTLVALYYSGSAKKKKRDGSGPLSQGETIAAEYQGSETPVAEAIGKACPDLVFPNHQDLDYVKVRLDPRSLKAARARLSSIDQAFARQMLWHALWEQVVDGLLPATEYEEIVLAHAGREKDTQVLQRVLSTLHRESNTSLSAWKIFPPELREREGDRLEKFARQGLEKAPAGSDLQLVWLRAFLRAARSSGANELLAALLDGKRKIPGLKIDQERRWEIIQALARNHFPGALDLIQAELSRDPTDMGTKASIAAEARVPSRALKEKWLNLVTRRSRKTSSGVEYKPAQLQEAISAYHSPDQEQFARAAIQPYFESLPALAASEDEDYVAAFAEEFFPSLCEKSLAQETASFLDSRSAALPAAVVKALKVHHQEELRCARARALVAAPAQPLASAPSPTPTAAAAAPDPEPEPAPAPSARPSKAPAPAPAAAPISELTPAPSAPTPTRSARSPSQPPPVAASPLPGTWNPWR